jgi:predicted secreted hydrolase
MKRWMWFSGLSLLAASLLAAAWLLRGSPSELQASLRVNSPENIEGFARADGPMPLLFPQDHGPHPDYQTEWWYFTGNMQDEQGRRFGYQLTFFRRALLPPNQAPARDSAWATPQVYMAHLALTDASSRQHHAFERLARGAAGLAGAQSEPFHVWLDDWQIHQTSSGVYELAASQDGVGINLTLTERKSPVLQGDQGYSQKGAEPGQASYYYSLTRLETQGLIQLPGGSVAVSGWSWMDHEFSTSALSQDQVGWDWFALQLSDGSELMMFQIRKEDGSIDPFSSGTFVRPDGSSVRLDRDDFSITVTSQWTSPESGGVYPAAWTLRIPSLDLELALDPVLADQELNVSYSYWEGAVQASGIREGTPLTGAGYVELTGYSGSMGGEF